MKRHVLRAGLAWVLALAFNLLSAQTTNVLQGTIKDSKGEPVIGAAVTVKGTQMGTTTDPDGKFSVAAPATAKTLVIKSIGFKTTEVDIAAGKFDLTLAEDVLNLDELVVTAIGIKKEKRALGYAVQDVSGDEITKAGNPDALSSLSAKVAGLTVTTASGQPGSAVNLQLRGPTSITGTNQPLIVVDGLPIDNTQNSTLFNATAGGSFGIGGDVNQNRGIDVNPDDIESISVLKGPAASALYGIQGANGVIVITTKRGTATGKKKFNVDISTSTTFDQVNKLQDLQNQWTQGFGGQYTTGTTRSWGPKADTLVWNHDPTGPAIMDGWDKNGDVIGKSGAPAGSTPFNPYNNATTFFRTGVTTDNTFSISGGTENGNFRASLTNLYQTGIIPLSDLNKTTAQIAGEFKVGQKVVIGGSAQYINSTISGDLSGSNVSAITFGVYRTPINFDNRNGITNSYTNPAMYVAPNGQERSYTYYYGASIFDNPYWSINENPYTDQTNRMIGSINMSADPTDWLNFTARAGADVYSDRRKQVFAVNSPGAPNAPYAGEDIEDQYFSRVVNSDIIAKLHHSFAHDFNGDIYIGNNIYSNYSTNEIADGTVYTIPGFNSLTNTQGVVANSQIFQKLTTAIYGGLDFDWKSQIYFGFTARNEWSSTLPSSHRSFFYPSINLGWVFTETAKLATNKWFPFGKIRLSWAEAGNDAPIYSLQNVYAVPIISDSWGGGIGFPFQSANGPLSGFQIANVLNNPNLKPELTNSYEAGIDLRFMPSALKHFGGFNIDLTYYYYKTTNDIVQAAVAPSTGYAAAYFNSGSMQNQGIEIQAGIVPVKAGSFKWAIDVNWAKNYNKVIALAPGLNQLTLGGFNGTTLIAQPGDQYGVIYGQDWLRDSKGDVIIDNRQNVNGSPNPNYGFPAADPAGTQTVIGNPYPKWMGGLRNTFSYKGLSLSLLFDVSFGAQIWDGTRGALTTYGRSASTNNRDANNVVYSGVTTNLDANGNVVEGSAVTKNTIPVNMGAIDPTSGISYAQEWYTGNGGGFGPVASQFVENASYFRLRELSLTYALERKWFKTKFISGVDISFIARNLFLVTPYKGQDPDQALAGAGTFPSVGKGLDYFNLPSTKSYGFAVKFHF